MTLLADFASKFFSRAKIAIGSLKQYPAYHIPTTHTFRGGKQALLEYFQELLTTSKRAVGETYAAVNDTRRSIAADIRKLIANVDFLHLLAFDEADLTADENLRTVLHKDRMREITPIATIWVVLNAAIALVLWKCSLLNEQVALIWSLFFTSFST